MSAALVRYLYELDPRGSIARRALCRCGWAGPQRPSKDAAEVDGVAHLREQPHTD
jgi:hypothetical protein